MKRILIKVTQKHINDGSYGDNSCPIANAIADTIPFSNPSVFPYFSCFYIKEKLIKSANSCRAQRFISKFDGGKPVKPFNFYLRLSETL